MSNNNIFIKSEMNDKQEFKLLELITNAVKNKKPHVMGYVSLDNNNSNIIINMSVSCPEFLTIPLVQSLKRACDNLIKESIDNDKTAMED